MLRFLIPFSTLLQPSAAAAQDACPDAVVLGVDQVGLEEHLSSAGLLTPAQAACTPIQVDARPANEAIAVTLTLPWGEQAQRVVADPTEAVTWVDSWLEQDRMGTLLEAPTLRTPSVRLYATLEDWQSGTVLLEHEGQVIRNDAPLVQRHLGGLDHFYSLDLSLSEGREVGKVFAVELDDQVYINPRRAKPNSMSPFGAMTVVGDYGVYQDEICVWVSQTTAMPAHMSCDAFVALIDLNTGDTQLVGKRKMRRWLEADATLHAAWQEEERRNDATVQRYLIALLTENPDAVAD